MSPDHFNLYLCQLNPAVGAIANNRKQAAAEHARASEQGADCIVFSELFICGYPPEDLILKPAFQDACRKAVEELAQLTVQGAAIIIGTPWVEDGQLYNALAVLDQGQIQTVRFKTDLPNYGVFDEKRIFTAGPLPDTVPLRGITLGLPVCEDIWKTAIAAHLCAQGAELLIIPNASPYWNGKQVDRLETMRRRVQENGVPLVYLNQVGGQDELVFDGGSFALDSQGRVRVQLESFSEQSLLTHWYESGSGLTCQKSVPLVPPHSDEADYQACVLGLRDYIRKNNFPGVVLGLSGGVDSALVAAMAVDALGSARVHAVMLPYRYTAPESIEDAAACAEALGIRYDVLPIQAGVAGLVDVVTPVRPMEGVALENVQSRIRGTILMALSNSSGDMVLTTGNKSEIAVGYCTLYGDMNGGFNPIKDVYKTQVYRMCALRNRWKPENALGGTGQVIPERILTKAPSAELREDQTDQDSLPPYDVLDAVLAALVEQDRSVDSIVASGFERETVRRIERLVNVAEYKRRQSAPGVKISQRQFGRDRRYPITNHFSSS